MNTVDELVAGEWYKHDAYPYALFQAWKGYDGMRWQAVHYLVWRGDLIPVRGMDANILLTDDDARQMHHVITGGEDSIAGLQQEDQ